ncbi:hypothetical protein [Mucilaginibacter sp.]|uniref:hypothetical protein n=1 Tax=Mucilaginibacter sp. TaxID=1882438 RepID=UPI0026079910|nr:hypothetical protein [Mucilaginibacter sp.]MDB5030419.1 hypothetical protein [Mucilaginibacter sp.]
MKTTCSYLLCATAVQLFTISICNAQTLALNTAPAGVAIDGNSKEWGDKMTYTDVKTKIDYTLTNDKDNLYLVVRTKDATQQSSILGAGITLSIDTKGKKKSSYIVTFPSSPADRDQSRYIDMPPQRIQGNTEMSAKFGKIHVEGFKDISEEELLVVNPYNILIAMSYDAASGYLTYEEAIPLALFHAGDLATKEWAFNIKLNPVQGHEKAGPKLTKVANTAKPTDKSAGKDAGRDEFSKSANIGLIDLTDEADFWGKFTLAK